MGVLQTFAFLFNAKIRTLRLHINVLIALFFYFSDIAFEKLCFSEIKNKIFNTLIINVLKIINFLLVSAIVYKKTRGIFYRKTSVFLGKIIFFVEKICEQYYFAKKMAGVSILFVG